MVTAVTFGGRGGGELLPFSLRLSDLFFLVRVFAAAVEDCVILPLYEQHAAPRRGGQGPGSQPFHGPPQAALRRKIGTRPSLSPPPEPESQGGWM